MLEINVAGWSSPVARQAHNLKVVGSNPTPATNKIARFRRAFLWLMPIECGSEILTILLADTNSAPFIYLSAHIQT